MSSRATSPRTSSAVTSPSTPPPPLEASHILSMTANTAPPSLLKRSRSPSPLRLPESPSESLSSSSTLPHAPPSSESAELWDNSAAGSEPTIGSGGESCITASADMVNKAFDTFQKLTAYNIHSEASRAMPDVLQSFVDDQIKAYRRITSPSARDVGRDHLVAVHKSERGGIELLAPNILLKGERHGGEAYIIQDAEVVFDGEHLPEAPSQKVVDTWSALSKSVPDHAIGYISSSDAGRWHVTAPFNQAQENDVVTAVVPAAATLFPFLTAEWKSGGGSEGHTHAALQAVRGAACVVNYNYAFLKHAGMVPTLLDTIHFSLTCNMDTVKLYVHWREHFAGDIHHYSKRIGSHNLSDADEDESNPDMLEFRARLRNILDWAVGVRLDTIQCAIGKIAKIERGGRKRRRCE
ncbi:hypothetical protein HBI16_200380 [Parastagonospora nodorum]|nr:hypothetical protein HBI16_200380 [Parastagonospora nodorum]